MTNEPPFNDDLDHLLSDWHDENRLAAERGRAAIMDRLHDAPASSVSSHGTRHLFRTHGTGLLAAALFVVVALLAVLALPTKRNLAVAQIIQVPDGGKLEAFDPEGAFVGPCPLQHTAVNAEISGPFVRVNLAQRFENTYQQKIEAVYTFPMSHRGAVDQMKMTITDPSGEVRYVIGEVKERSLARYIYEQAKESGYVASLLEQERPNIFTQSVANIEPGATVLIEIAYIEVLESTDGEYTFEFPTVVGPRYIPGAMSSSIKDLPEGVVPKPGVVLLGPANIESTEHPGTEGWTATSIDAALKSAFATNPPPWAGLIGMPPFHAAFTATYSDGSSETGFLFNDNFGSINGRFFYWNLPTDSGNGFSPNTDQVPDASVITPMPVKPPLRAGHNISINVTLDTGGVGVTAFGAPLHEIEQSVNDGVYTVSLKDQKTIPNRDFVLRWRLEDDAIEESIFTHVSQEGGFLSMVLAPPARVEDATVRARELIFVLDTSGSMRGFPIEKSKGVATKAIASMRAGDTFNVITFSGSTAILWPDPRPATEANQAEAMRFIDTLQGGGGTEMMTAINAALVQTVAASSVLSPEQLVELPADGRKVAVGLNIAAISTENGTQWITVREGLTLPLSMSVVLPTPSATQHDLVLDGVWQINDGRRILNITAARWKDAPAFAPMRIAMFFTDGYVGNDQAIIQAVRDNAHSTRVFSFGIGNSVNRYLLDEMSAAGRGEVEYVLLNDEADKAVERLARRIQTPVLTDIQVSINGVDVTDVLPKNRDGLLPDLYDEKAIVLHARFVPPATGSISGSVTITGRTGHGRYERVIPVEFPAVEAANDSIATLWARAKVDDVLAPYLMQVQQQNLAPNVKAAVVRLGETFSIMTPYTSFIAVEKSRVTIGGQPMLVSVPIELPEGTSWEGFFQSDCPPAVQRRQAELLAMGGRGFVSEEAQEMDEPLAEFDDMLKKGEDAEVRLAGEAGSQSKLGSRREALGRHASPGQPFAPSAQPSNTRGSRIASARTRKRAQTLSGQPGGAASGPVATGGVRFYTSPSGGGGGGFGGGGGSNAAAPMTTTADLGLESVTIANAVDAIDKDRLGWDERAIAGELVDSPIPTPTAVALEIKVPSIDLDKIWRTLDRSLLLLALGATPEEVPGLPKKGLDGKPFVFEGSVEVTLLFDGSGGSSAALKALQAAGFTRQGESANGSIVVGRVAISDLLALAQVDVARRIVPTS